MSHATNTIAPTNNALQPVARWFSLLDFPNPQALARDRPKLEKGTARCSGEGTVWVSESFGDSGHPEPSDRDTCCGMLQWACPAALGFGFSPSRYNRVPLQWLRCCSRHQYPVGKRKTSVYIVGRYCLARVLLEASSCSRQQMGTRERTKYSHFLMS